MNEPVLLLNANFEPLNVCTMRRAVGLMMMGKAEILVNGRGVITTASSSIPRPSILRLAYMVNRPRPRVKLTKREVFRRDNHHCQYCGRRVSDMTIDHVLPRHRGGQHTWKNLVSACPGCNRKKGGRTPQEAGMNLMQPPGEPSASAVYLFGHHLKDNEEWRSFVEGW